MNVRQFSGKTEAILSVPCTFDLNVSATKYFYALEDGEAPLLFLFSGTIFYQGADERLQIQQVSWNKECTYRMPIGVWKEMMDHHYPNTAWLSLERDLFERLYAFRRREGLATWEAAIERCCLRQRIESKLANAKLRNKSSRMTRHHEHRTRREGGATRFSTRATFFIRIGRHRGRIASDLPSAASIPRTTASRNMAPSRA